MIQINNIEKSFNNKEFRLGPINLTIKSSETHALFGHNGAGKSTLFQLITGNMDPGSGEIKILDQRMSQDNYELKKSIGYLPQHLTLPRWVTPNEILGYATTLYAIKDPTRAISKQLKYWDCEYFAKRPIDRCSHGMQKRVSLALANIHNPEILILDEPFSGLDIHHIKALREKIASRQESKKATIVCTHMAPYAAKLCTSASLMWNGKIESIMEWPNENYEDRINTIEGLFSRTR